MIIWIIIGVIALAIDIFTSAFLFCWFAAGALAALICNLLGMSLGVQVLVFFIVSAVLAIICYPIVKRKIKDIDKRINVRYNTSTKQMFATSVRF